MSRRVVVHGLGPGANLIGLRQHVEAIQINITCRASTSILMVKAAFRICATTVFLSSAEYILGSIATLPLSKKYSFVFVKVYTVEIVCVLKECQCYFSYFGFWESEISSHDFVIIYRTLPMFISESRWSLILKQTSCSISATKVIPNNIFNGWKDDISPVSYTHLTLPTICSV